jgi:spermidine/putrescine transport system permease protein
VSVSAEEPLPAGRRLLFGLSRLLPLSVLPTLVWLTVGLVIPVGVFFVYGFWRADIFGLVREWNLDQYRDAFGDAFYRELLLRTIGLGLLVAAVCLPLAYAAAHVLTFSVRRWRNELMLLIVISMLASYLVRIYSWKTILGPQGVINRGLELGGLIDKPLEFLLFGKFAVVVTLVHILLPLAVLPIYAAMQTVDHDIMRASRDLGGGPVVTFLRVTLPLTWHGVVVAFLFTFILAAGDYVTPQLVGGKGGVMVGRVIYDQFGITQNWPLASALAFALIAFFAATVGLLWLAVRLLRRAASRWRPRSSGRGFMPAGASAILRRVPWGPIYLGLVLLYLFFPLALVILFSFNDSPISALPIRGLTLGWYREALGSATFRDAFATSLKLAAVVSAIAIAIGVPAAFALARRRFALRSVVALLLVLPVALPGVIIGFSILTMVTQVDVTPSIVSAGLGQATFLVPFVVLIVSARLRNFDRQIEEAGRDLGCTPPGVLRRITLPIIAPTILGAALLCFALAMDEFVITLYTIGSDTTLPLLVWGLMQKRGITPTVNAIATVLLLASFLVLLATALVARRRSRRSVVGAFVGSVQPSQENVQETARI